MGATSLDCLAKRPSDRPASAAVLAERLRELGARGWNDARTWWCTHQPAKPDEALDSPTTMAVALDDQRSA